MTRGFLIAVCGIDGSGKSTQVARLRDHLGTRLGPVATTRQPTDRYRQDEVVRAALGLDVPFAAVGTELALLSAFDRARHLREEVLPALDRGTSVITDRYVYSTYAYFVARGLDLPWLLALNLEVPVPDLTLCLDLPPEQAVERVRARDGSSHTREEVDVARMSRVRDLFVEQPWGPSDTYRIIDAALDPDDVWAQIDDAAGCLGRR